MRKTILCTASVAWLLLVASELVHARQVGNNVIIIPRTNMHPDQVRQNVNNMHEFLSGHIEKINSVASVASTGQGAQPAKPFHVKVHQGQAFAGISGNIPNHVLEKLSLSDHGMNIMAIEQDSIAAICAPLYNVTEENNASWNLVRVSSAVRPPDTRPYYYPDTAGKRASVYIIDTGINVNHPEFEGRAHFLKDFTGTVNTDNHGHGTHCAGTVGSKTYGIAKKSTLYAIKVLGADGTGLFSWIIEGINYAVEHAKNDPARAIISLSLGGGKSQAMDMAIAAANDAGLATIGILLFSFNFNVV